ncbi:uncharacterized protein Fot_31519 [Forsythia ovata]|uniref:Uncharacterized protein n=1 Tax=Forsythia ovata TaxID=205694 RepID=A0ABD1T5B4_9LAMI
MGGAMVEVVAGDGGDYPAMILMGENLRSWQLIAPLNDDLKQMMHEYDWLYRVFPKPLRLRVFIFHNMNPSSNSSVRSFGSDDAKSEKERFVEVLNSGLVMIAPLQVAATAVLPQPPPANNNVDYFFELEKGVGMAPQPLQLMLGKVEVDDHVPGFEKSWGRSNSAAYSGSREVEN